MPSLNRSILTVAFVCVLLAWTWALLSPNPVPEPIRDEIGTDWKFILSKLLHAGGYAFLTVLGTLLPRTRRGQLWMIAGLSMHAVLSEVGQAAMDLGRHGSVRDVLIDWVGIALGFAIRRWSAPVDSETLIPRR